MLLKYNKIRNIIPIKSHSKYKLLFILVQSKLL
jgi:hypothetical protein